MIFEVICQRSGSAPCVDPPAGIQREERTGCDEEDARFSGHLAIQAERSARPDSVLIAVAVRGVREVLRRFLPARFINWYRRRRYEKSRNNVIVLLAASENLDTWVRSTPNTYRFGRHDSVEADADDAVVVGGSGESERGIAVGAMTFTGCRVGVSGDVRRPSRIVWGERDVRVEPRAVAIDQSLLADLGGSLDSESPRTLYRRVWDAGVEMAVVSQSVRSVSRPVRDDPINRPCVIVLSAVPMHDVGGGSRATQLSIAMVGAGAHVVHVSLFPSYESDDLGLRFVHPHLEQYRFEELEPEQFLERTGFGWVLVEAPTPEAVSLAVGLADRGWKVCYDIIDNWSDTALGTDWYRERWETRLIEASDLVCISASDLDRRPEASGVDSLLIPNAVDGSLFGRVPGPRPADLPSTGKLIGYHGSLYGNWIDWEAISAVAQANPDAELVMIGDVSRGHPAVPSNVRFLGLKPQQALPAYVTRFDVGLVPFKVSETTQSVSPLKVYEYLASGVPVAAPPLRPLHGLEGVYQSEDLVDSVYRALAAPRPDPHPILEHHSWAARVRDLSDAMGLDLHRGHSGREVSRVIRKPVKYLKGERIVQR